MFKKNNTKKETQEPVEKPGFYKGYDIRWLKKQGEEHPAYNLVTEYEEEFDTIEI